MFCILPLKSQMGFLYLHFLFLVIAQAASSSAERPTFDYRAFHDSSVVWDQSVQVDSQALVETQDGGQQVPTGIPTDANAKDRFAIVPGVNKNIKKIREINNMPETALFYTEWFLAPTSEQQRGRTIEPADAARKWLRKERRIRDGATCNITHLFSPEWVASKTFGLEQPFRGIIPEGTAEFYRKTTWPWFMQVSEAFAEESKGPDAVLMIPWFNLPKKNSHGEYMWNPEKAWGSWEFPTLIRNERIRNIYLVDPVEPDKLPLTKIWSSHQGTNGTTLPRGSLKSFLPKDLPSKFIPRRWQTYDDNNNISSYSWGRSLSQ
jgi:hypothetical protein